MGSVANSILHPKSNPTRGELKGSVVKSNSPPRREPLQILSHYVPSSICMRTTASSVLSHAKKMWNQ